MRVAARGGRTLVDPGGVGEEKRTTYLLRRPLQAAMSILALRPRRFVKALVTTQRMMRRSDRAPLVDILSSKRRTRSSSSSRAHGEHLPNSSARNRN
jgi:hypothetical protein